MPINEHDIERLREVFVAKDECWISRDELSKKIGRDDVRLSVIESQLKLILWLLTAVAGAIITVLVKLFLGG